MFSAVISSTNSWVILLKSSFPRTWPESLGVTRHDGVDDAELNAKLSNVSSPVIRHTQCMLQLNWNEHLSPINHVSIVWRSYHLGDSQKSVRLNYSLLCIHVHDSNQIHFDHWMTFEELWLLFKFQIIFVVLFVNFGIFPAKKRLEWKSNSA